MGRSFCGIGHDPLFTPPFARIVFTSQTAPRRLLVDGVNGGHSVALKRVRDNGTDAGPPTPIESEMSTPPLSFSLRLDFPPYVSLFYRVTVRATMGEVV